jgi:hypothetical protein
MQRRLPAADAVDDEFRALQELSPQRQASERVALDAERQRRRLIATVALAVGAVLILVLLLVALVH